MKHSLHYMILLLLLLLIIGCAATQTSNKCSVVQYGSQYMKYSGSRSLFDEACRRVLHDFSHKIDHGDGKTEYPFYGEGGSTAKDEDRLISMRAYLKTKDSDGNDYKITTIFLGENAPVVIIEDSSREKHKLVNALNTEFVNRGIKVTIY